MIANLDQMYLDRRLLSEKDFRHIYEKVKMDREWLQSLKEQEKQPVSAGEKVRALVKEFLDSDLIIWELIEKKEILI